MLETSLVRMCETKAVKKKKKKVKIKHLFLNKKKKKKQVVKYNAQYDATIRSEYPNLDELVMDLKLTPDCLDIPIPRFFKEENKKQLDERN